MAWKYCNVCHRSYNDKLGGCKNSACSQFQPAPQSAVKTQAPSPAAAAKPVIPKPALRTKPAGIPKPAVVPRPAAIPKAATPRAAVNNGPASVPASTESAAASPQVNVQILQWINSPPEDQLAPTGIPVIQRFNMTCYRGEKSEWWPDPKIRLASGMTVYEPWPYNNMTELWDRLVQEIRRSGGGTPNGFAQHLRAEGKPYAVATARSRGGAFEGYNYEIEIENARTFYWGPNLTLGPPANFLTARREMREERVEGRLVITSHDTVSADYIVLNADTIADSTILGFGHKTATYEVTFFHDLPIQYVKKCNGQLISALNILSKQQVQALPDNEKNRSAKKLLR